MLAGRDNPTNLRLLLDGNGKAKAVWNHPWNYQNKPSVYKVYYKTSFSGTEYIKYSSSTFAIIGPCVPDYSCTVRLQGLSPDPSCYAAILGPVTLNVNGKASLVTHFIAALDIA